MVVARSVSKAALTLEWALSQLRQGSMASGVSQGPAPFGLPTSGWASDADVQAAQAPGRREEAELGHQTPPRSGEASPPTLSTDTMVSAATEQRRFALAISSSTHPCVTPPSRPLLGSWPGPHIQFIQFSAGVCLPPHFAEWPAGQQQQQRALGGAAGVGGRNTRCAAPPLGRPSKAHPQKALLPGCQRSQQQLCRQPASLPAPTAGNPAAAAAASPPGPCSAAPRRPVCRQHCCGAPHWPQAQPDGGLRRLS